MDQEGNKAPALDAVSQTMIPAPFIGCQQKGCEKRQVTLRAKVNVVQSVNPCEFLCSEQAGPARFSLIC